MQTALNPITDKSAFLSALAQADAFFARRIDAEVDCVERALIEKVAHDKLWSFIGFQHSFSAKSVQAEAIKGVCASMRMYARTVIDQYIATASAGLNVQVNRESLLSDWLPHQKNEYHDVLLSKLDGSPEQFAVSLNHLRSTTFIGLYQTLDAAYNPQKTQDLMYKQAAEAIIEYFGFNYRSPEPVKGGFLIEKRLYGVELQYSSRANTGKYRVGFSYVREGNELSKWLQIFGQYAGDSDLYHAMKTFLFNLDHNHEGFNPRDAYEYGDVKITMYKSKVEFKIPAPEFTQLFTFCRLYGNLKQKAA